MEVIYELIGKKRYHREILELSDGGEIALDWLIFPDKKQHTQSGRHIIALIPGVNGDGEKMYAIALH
jgi:predicted alpha/beta-fold hydrolase